MIFDSQQKNWINLIVTGRIVQLRDAMLLYSTERPPTNGVYNPQSLTYAHGLYDVEEAFGLGSRFVQARNSFLSGILEAETRIPQVNS